MSKESKNQKKTTIMLVEDEPSIIELVTMALEKNGYRTINVIQGTEVIDTIQKEKPDLVILDIMIPKINGFEICRQLKNDNTMKHIPVLVLSSLVQKSEIEMGIRVGADIYMTKPFQNKDLLRNIEKLLKRVP